MQRRLVTWLVAILLIVHGLLGCCWHHRHDVGANAAHADLCLRCVTNVDGEGEQRVFA